MEQGSTMVSVPLELLMTNEVAQTSPMGRAIAAAHVDLRSGHTLLAAYLLLTSFVIRRVLSWRTRRLLNQITSVARAAVNDRGEVARHAVAEITQRMRDALQRLANLSAMWRERLGQGPSLPAQHLGSAAREEAEEA